MNKANLEKKLPALPTKKGTTIIIGGGFYGLRIALFLCEELGVKDILIIEKEDHMMTRASYVNQARVHNGYHYPRSVLTAYRSAVNFPRFTEEYKDAIVSDFDKYYGIARHLSKVNANQFKHFAEKIGSDIADAPKEIDNLFNTALVEKVFKVKEFAFDSSKLCNDLLEKIQRHPEIRLKSGENVEEILHGNAGLGVKTDKNVYFGEHVLNCTYSYINTLHRKSGLPFVGLKHEITEMCLVRLPKPIEDLSITMMDGPFFSIMPFPPKRLHTLSHVRYTPHESWIDNDGTVEQQKDVHKYFAEAPFKTNYPQMYNDVVRFIPALKDMEYVESITEVKTVLIKSEDDDSRPILYRSDLGVDGYVCIMGGKVDNIYDVFEELTKTYGNK